MINEDIKPKDFQFIPEREERKWIAIFSLEIYVISKEKKVER